MSQQPNLLAQVRQYLINRGEVYQWVTMGPSSEKIGLAYLPIDATSLPCTFMFTELREPCSLVFDVHFAIRAAHADLRELSMLLLSLNSELPEGQLLLDMEGGFVYYRLKFVVDDLNITPEEIRNRVEHMETVGIGMAETYVPIIAGAFPTAR